ncbi:hypothetical protein J0H58_04125, partial [bacterium]|nr:hypothetical protein [bacterium]
MTRLRVSRRTCLVALAAPAVPRPPAAPVPPPRPAPGWLAVANVTLIDVAAGVGWPGATVLVRGDRIAAVGPAAAVAVPPAARIIDGRGKFLIPGLWDAHAHLADPGFYGLYLRAGVTGVRHMLGPNPLFSPAEPPDHTAGPVQPRVVRAHHALDGPDTPFPFPARPQIIPVARPREVAAALD